MARRDIIAIGASAGGIAVLETILSALPWDFQVSLFVVVHTSEESPGLLPEILNRSSRLPVVYAVHNAPILPSRVYVAPSGRGTWCSSAGEYDSCLARAKTAPGRRSMRSSARPRTPTDRR